MPKSALMHEYGHSHPTFLSDFILGSQDGLVNVLGIVLGVSAATANVTILLVAALAALGAETISMAAVAYTSTNARRNLYLKEVDRELREIKEVPKIEEDEIRVIFEKWGYKGRELKQATKMIISNPKAWLEIMMAFELGLSPVNKKQPFRSFMLVGTATLIGSIIPLLPFLFTPVVHTGIIASVIISAIALFFIGAYEAKTTVGSLWASGLRMLMIGMIAGFAGYLIGHFIGAVPV